MRPIDEQLAHIRDKDKSGSRKRIVILGAGMAGLVAAYELHHLGHSVEVIEASDRVGGRVFTYRFKDGQYNELGAMRIPASHDYTRHYAVNICGLKLRPFVTAHKNLKCFYDIRDVKTRIEDARKQLLPRFKLSPAERRLATEAVAPAILGEHFDGAIRDLSADDEASLFDFRPTTAPSLNLDSNSLLAFLRSRIHPGSEALELIGTTTGLESLWDKSAAMFIRDEIIGTGGGLTEIVGGMDLLPTGLAGRIPADTIKLKTELLAVQWAGKKGKLLLCTKGEEPHQVEADWVICTIPFSVFRGLDITGFGSQKMSAIRNLSYASSTKVLIHCRERFWERPPYEIVGGASMSDQIIRSTYYPSDHAADLVRDVLTASARGITTAYNLASPVRLGEDLSHEPGVLLGSYCWGQDARRLGSLSPEGRASCVVDKIARFHPEIRDLADDHASMNWDEYKWSRGAFSFLEPGDQQLYLNSAVQPEGSFHFAGEHCSTDQAWIQGAAISALRAVEEILGQ